MAFVTAEDGVRIHYETEGDGTPLVLMHGLGGGLESWRNGGYVERLRDRFQLILIDSRGRGQSDYPRTQEAYELRTRVVDVATVLTDLGVQKAHYLGYAMGAWIGWGITVYMPQRFHSLALGGFGPVADPFEGGTVEAHFGDQWNKFADEEQDVVRLMFAEMARFGGARHALKLTNLPLLLFAGERDPHFSSLVGATQLAKQASFFALDGKDHRTAYSDAAAVETVCERASEFFAGVPVG